MSMVAAVRIEPRKPDLYVELIAHELEHVLEHIDGMNLPMLASRKVNSVGKWAGQYETARAQAVGATVAREVIRQ